MNKTLIIGDELYNQIKDYIISNSNYRDVEVIQADQLSSAPKADFVFVDFGSVNYLYTNELFDDVYIGVINSKNAYKKENYYFVENINSFSFQMLINFYSEFMEKLDINESLKQYQEICLRDKEEIITQLREQMALYREANKLFNYQLKRFDNLQSANEYIKDYSDSIIENLSEGFVTLDNDFRVERWNKQMEKITGIDKNTILKHSFANAVPHFYSTKLKHYFYTVLEKGEIIVDDAFMYYDEFSGKKRMFALEIFPIKQRDRNIGIGMLIDDITERKKTEERAIIGMMSLYLSHIIRNSINIIGGYTKYLVTPNLDETKKEKYFSIVKSEVGKIEESISTIETFSTMKATINHDEDSDFIVLINDYLDIVKSGNFDKIGKKTYLENYLDRVKFSLNVPIGKNVILPVRLNKSKFYLSLSYFLKDIIKFLRRNEDNEIEILMSIENLDENYILFYIINNSPYWRELDEDSILAPWHHKIKMNTFDLWGVAIFNSMMGNFNGTFSLNINNNMIKFIAKIPKFKNEVIK